MTTKRRTQKKASGLSEKVLGNCEKVAKLFASLSHPTRLKILCRLMEAEETVGGLTEFCGISQPAMSQFLTRMRDDGLVETRKEGVRVYYRIAESNLTRLLEATRKIYLKDENG